MSKITHVANMVEFNTVVATCTCANIRKAARAITQLYDEALQPSGLMINQFTVLVAIAIVGFATMTNLAQDLAMDRTTLTRNLQPLEKQGLVRVEIGGDRRTRVIGLTDKGFAAIEKALPLWEEIQNQMIEKLGQDRWRLLILGLSSTVELIQQL